MLRLRKSHRIIFEGQSLNNVPPDEGNVLGRGYPWHVMRGLGLPYDITAVNGTPFNEPTHPTDDLITTIGERVIPLIGRDEKTIVIICGGTSDVSYGDSADALYDDHVAHAATLLDAGADHVLTTTICNATIFDSTEQEEREAANILLLANADSIFTSVIDLSSTGLEDPSDEVPGGAYSNPYYYDGVHWYNPGAILAADTVRPHLLAALAL